ncbi:T9SS type A sorting domain-containing protein [Taibaiella lutea]|uniref:T9SS type A sorting domain-containing protein n=1 Tax=Taibaiella lutea TaxID=2608001 RepID=A0A5M6CIG2_9BACT|nr:T9SS type A sorting domain-containing protein [Taibaiella lutea]KAA5533175.1 T9SS type A sorting domain-containing protein [Taibaiella lutea]
MKLKLLFAAFSILFIQQYARAAYVPMAVASGYNADVIANGVGTGLTTTTNDVDAVSYCFVSTGWQQTSSSTPFVLGLPASGTINSAATSGLTFQMASYSGNNDIRIPNNNVPYTMSFTTPQAAQNLYLLAVTGSGSCTMTVVINFTDGSSQTSTGITVADWYGGTGIALTGMQRLNRTTNIADNAFNGPNLYQYTFAINAANQTKLLSNVIITRTTNTGTETTLNIFAASIQQSTIVSCPAPTSPTATSITTTTASLNWNNTGTPINYQIKYGAPGFNVNTAGTSIFTPTKPYTLNPPLNVSTSYDFYVRSVCTAGDTSAWSPVTNFTTLCNAPSVVSKKDSFNCGTGIVNLEAATTSGASIKWYAAATGGTALATGNSYATPSISVTTTYYISAVSGTCESTPRQAVVATIRPIPAINLGHDTTLCPGISYTFNAGNAGGAYLWSPGGQTTQTITTNAVGQYSVSVTVNKCENKDTIVITPGLAPVNNLPDTTNLCEGSETTLNAGNTGSTFLWTPGSAATQTLNVSTGGSYSVSIKSMHGCKLTSGTYVKMRPLPVDNLGNDTSICESTTLLLDAGNTGYSYAWSTGATSQAISASDSGTYIATVTTPYTCVNIDSIHIAFLPSPRTEGFNFIPEFYDALGKVSFTPLNPTNVNSFEWDFGDGSALVTAINPTHVYNASGEYNVTLKVYNDCTDFSLSQKINVDLPTGMVTLNKNDISLMIYPNPAKSILNISNKSTDYEMQDVMLFNALGAMVYHQKADSKAMHRLSVESLSSGVYFVRVLTNRGFVNQQIQIVK